MKKILLFGAGKSASTLISYLGRYCQENNVEFKVCDQDLDLANAKISGFTTSKAISIDVTNETARQSQISDVDIVISMLPPALHFLVAKDCVQFFKPLLTASYVDDNMRSLAPEIKSRGLLFLAEMGLDPGIDHMSAMSIISSLKEQGAKIISFYSHCGGLVAPESDDNPWHYKITWNPANVVMAGSAGATYLLDNKVVQKDYKEIFSRKDQTIVLPETGVLAWYANRDSLPYLEIYGLQDIQTFIRTTLRYPSFNRAWNVIVNLGLTQNDDKDQVRNCKTYRDWYELKKATASFDEVPEKELDDKELREQFHFLGLNSTDVIPVTADSSSRILQTLLEKNLVMHPDDKDMIVMIHEVTYEINGKIEEITSSLIVKGNDRIHTAMSKTVGLPLAIATTLILENKLDISGLHIPVIAEIYKPVLAELQKNGIIFNEKLG